MDKFPLFSWRLTAVLCATVLAGCAPKPSAPEQMITQHIELQGARNFRDLGGYTTSDGRRVKTGLLYRADSLAELTESDLHRLQALHLRTIYDFRTSDEARQAPDKPLPGAVRVALPIGEGQMNVATLQAQILAGDLDALNLSDSYGDMLLNATDPLRTWFADLLNPQKNPAVFHCTGGKDRTGMAAALLLVALGVPQETVMQDYLASNYYLHDHIESTLWKVRFASHFRVDGDRFRAIVGVRDVYLENAFKAIIYRYGSIDNYLEQVLQLDAGKRQQLRQIYLE